MYLYNFNAIDLSGPSSPPELITTDCDSIIDPDSEDEAERKDSLDVHEEGQLTNENLFELF